MTLHAWQTAFYWLIFAGALLVAIGGVCSKIVAKKIEERKGRVAAKREQVLDQKVDRLVEGNEQLRERLEPMAEMLQDLYPDLDEQTAMDALRSEVQEVRERTETLERDVAPRRLSPAQADRIRPALQDIEPQRVLFKVPWGDQEAFKFAEDLRQLFISAGWEVEGIERAMFNGPLSGLLLETAKPPTPEHPVQDLYRALRRGGLEVGSSLNRKSPSDRFVIVVGSKP